MWYQRLQLDQSTAIVWWNYVPQSSNGSKGSEFLLNEWIHQTVNAS